MTDVHVPRFDPSMETAKIVAWKKKVGEKVESIYEKLQVAESFKDLIGRIAKALSKIYDIPWIPGDFLEEKVLRKVLSLLLRKAKQERGYSKKALSKDAEKCLKAYISGPLLRQFREEAEDDPDQYDITFIFGHTHKPFSDFIKAGKRIKVYNTGGWTVDTIYPNPLYGGSVIFIDEGLNVISFNMFFRGFLSLQPDFGVARQIDLKGVYKFVKRLECAPLCKTRKGFHVKREQLGVA